jgi:hypothetical protein
MTAKMHRVISDLLLKVKPGLLIFRIFRQKGDANALPLMPY